MTHIDPSTGLSAKRSSPLYSMALPLWVVPGLAACKLCPSHLAHFAKQLGRYSPAIQQISEQYHVGTEVSLLGLSVLLCGFGLGPLLWAPLSEAKGRKPAVLIPYFLAAVFSFATAAAKDIQTIIITRFFAGFFGSAVSRSLARLSYLCNSVRKLYNATTGLEHHEPRIRVI